MNENIRKILSENGLEEYISLFEKNRLDNLEILSNINESDYEKMGISIMGDRKRLIKLFYENEMNEKSVMQSNNPPHQSEPIREKVIEKVVVEKQMGGEQVIIQKSNSGCWIFVTVVVAIILGAIMVAAGG